MDFSKKIYPGITGKKTDWVSKIDEINELGISSAAFFIERFEKGEREKMYQALLKSPVKEVPLVHMRHDAGNDEIKFFIDNFKTKYFNIHEENFNIIGKWEKYRDKLYLELNYDDSIARNVSVESIGGFCVDLAHFKAAIARGSEEAYYVFRQKNNVRIPCNHLSGYSFEKNRDVHFAASNKDFDYLATLPKYVFGEAIALEIDNGIKEQLAYKEHIVRLLNDCFRGQP